jgi:7-cyano-7-deazaguanine synthase
VKVMQRKAVILFSGGLDSTTCLAIAQSQGFDCYAISFNYGQKHVYELDAAKRIATKMGVKEHKIVNLGLGTLTNSALTDNNLSIPDFKKSGEIPTTYIPARNLVFLSIALSWAEGLGSKDIFIGANQVDYSGYPDCRPLFLKNFELAANAGTKSGTEGVAYKIHAPILDLAKHEIIQLGSSLGVDYGLTLSCYRANWLGESCGTCDSCHYRKTGFEKANMVDPTRYFSVLSAKRLKATQI